MNEIWIHLYDSEGKVQSKQWKHDNSPPPKKSRDQPSAGKILPVVFWDHRRVVMINFLVKETTINGAYHATVLHKLQDAIEAGRRVMLTKRVHLNQDDGQVHDAGVVQLCCRYEILIHPRYPELALFDFHLFPTMNSFLKGKHFSDDDELVSEVKSWLQTQPADFYRRDFHSCIKRW
ncbi:histone-lysine N-methyltransferase SETMAR-like [Octopus sinensis]|uniref:Histone-lysine N-methyltransferase SETMAR-like n=1 Tax=Octopus sinensis TaxID=2607531 RepID=A0A6P7T1M9_9MOLL|nr:histone-lysine N-methyltransferase SETMAR-like [Octopus sinensis]